MSRRERREMQEREEALAELRAEQAQATAAAAEPEPEPEADAPEPQDEQRPLTRKERRRLERLERPMETWTAEEETAHTGQIPTVTPEVIAEQERLARERAEQAQREAQTASEGIAVVAAEPAQEAPAEVAEPAQEAPAEVAEPEPQAPSHWEAELAATAPRDEAPESPASPSEVTTDEIETTPAAPTAPAAGGIPEGLKHLFPAGSLQARAAQAAAEAAAAEAESDSAAEEPIADDATTPIPEQAQAEQTGPSFIGMNGLDAAAPGYQEPSTEIPLAATTPVQGVTAPAPDETVADVNAIGGGAVPSQASAYLGFGAPEPDQEQDSFEQPAAPEMGAQPQQGEQSSPPAWQEPEAPAPAAPAPQYTAPSIDDLVTGAVQQAPSNANFGMTPIERLATTGQIPAVSEQAAESSPEWDQPEPKPLTEPVRLEGDDQPSPMAPPTSLPTPQAAAPQEPQHPVEAVAQAFPPSSGTPYVPPLTAPSEAGLAAARTQVATTSLPVGNALIPTTGPIAMSNPTTGSIPTVTGAITRPTVELPPAGGLRHFSWVHFAVFGAVAFVLGVVLINVVKATG